MCRPTNSTCGAVRSPAAASRPADLAAPVGNASRQPNRDILEHAKKREIELKLLELQDDLEEQGCARMFCRQLILKFLACMRLCTPAAAIHDRHCVQCLLDCRQWQAHDS